MNLLLHASHFSVQYRVLCCATEETKLDFGHFRLGSKRLR